MAAADLASLMMLLSGRGQPSTDAALPPQWPEQPGVAPLHKWEDATAVETAEPISDEVWQKLKSRAKDIPSNQGQSEDTQNLQGTETAAAQQ